MMIDKVWKDPVWSKIIATLIISLFGYLSYLLGLDFLLVSKLAKNLLNIVLKTYEIQLWLVLLLVLFPLKSLVTFYTKKKNNSFNNNYKEHYKFDKIMGLRWEWEYSPTDEITNLTPLCPECSMEMKSTESQGITPPKLEFSCPKCSYVHSFTGWENLPLLVKQLIERIIRLKLWNKRIA